MSRVAAVATCAAELVRLSPKERRAAVRALAELFEVALAPAPPSSSAERMRRLRQRRGDDPPPNVTPNVTLDVTSQVTPAASQAPEVSPAMGGGGVLLGSMVPELHQSEICTKNAVARIVGSSARAGLQGSSTAQQDGQKEKNVTLDVTPAVTLASDADPRVARIRSELLRHPKVAHLGADHRHAEYLLSQAPLAASAEAIATAIGQAMFDLEDGANDAAAKRKLRAYVSHARPPKPPGEVEHAARTAEEGGRGQRYAAPYHAPFEDEKPRRAAARRVPR